MPDTGAVGGRTRTSRTWSAAQMGCAALVALLLCAPVACGQEGGGSAASESAAAEPAAAEPAASKGHEGHDHSKRTRRPLPAFEGRSLTGEAISVSSLIGKRFVLFFFNPEVPDAAPAAKAVRDVATLRGAHNFEVVGVAMGASSGATRSFVEEQGLDFRVIDDSSGRIARRLGLRARVVFVGVDAEGYLSFGVSGEAGPGDEAAAGIAAQLRDRLRLPGAEERLALGLGENPIAPVFQTEDLSGAGFDFASTRGHPAILIFFLHTCPHCHEALRTMRKELDAMPEEARPRLIGVSVSNRASQVRARLRQDDLDFFPVLVDPGSEVRELYGVMAGVPDIFLIDAKGAITARVRGWREGRDDALMRMRLAKLAGRPVPMLLDAKGYSGNELCAVCHTTEQATWEFGKHASAFDTLVKHGADADPECVSCHVVGYDEAGGYDIEAPAPHLEDVGCETCHGRGGPHLSPAFAKKADYESVCVTCHNPTHSLGFTYDAFLPKVSHAATEKLLAGLSLEEKRALVEERNQRRTQLLPTNAAYVGSEACRSCHAAEFETWSGQPHARAGDTLVAKGKAGDADCLACHTTAYDKQGGFPAAAALSDHADLGRVGCESCHGPGGDHVKEDVKKIGSIVSLGDKCDSCVILQICGGCHDDANDPGFEFEVQDKIDRQRHGTIEAGTGKPKSGESARLERAPDTALLGLAFHALDRRG